MAIKSPLLIIFIMEFYITFAPATPIQVYVFSLPCLIAFQFSPVCSPVGFDFLIYINCQKVNKAIFMLRFCFSINNGRDRKLRVK